MLMKGISFHSMFCFTLQYGFGDKRELQTSWSGFPITAHGKQMFVFFLRLLIPAPNTSSGSEHLSKGRRVLRVSVSAAGCQGLKQPMHTDRELKVCSSKGTTAAPLLGANHCNNNEATKTEVWGKNKGQRHHRAPWCPSTLLKDQLNYFPDYPPNPESWFTCTAQKGDTGFYVNIPIILKTN